MNPLLLYLLLLKATLTSFSGMTSLVVVHDDLVVQRKVLTERQLTTAVAMGRLVPGPNGLYLVGAGYFIAGVPGAAAGLGALITPAFLIIVLLRTLGRRVESPEVMRTIRAVILAAAGLILSAAVPLARDALTGPPAIAIAAGSMAALTFTKADTVWVILAAGLCGLLVR
jgi:chromate transporter